MFRLDQTLRSRLLPWDALYCLLELAVFEMRLPFVCPKVLHEYNFRSTSGTSDSFTFQNRAENTSFFIKMETLWQKKARNVRLFTETHVSMMPAFGAGVQHKLLESVCVSNMWRFIPRNMPNKNMLPPLTYREAY